MSTRSERPAVQHPIVVAKRDASFYQYPSRRLKVWHVATTEWTAACQPGPKFAAGTVPLDESMQERQPVHIYDDMRCQRPGCRVWWALVPSKPRLGES